MAESIGELLEEFLQAVYRLEPTGPGGFEGFVRDLLQEALSARFRLMKSGYQGGVDAVNELHGNALSIGFEGKRYSSSTRLSLDGLKYKIFDASQVHAGLDIWALATTREISATDALALRGTGESLGVAVAIIDPSGAPYALSPMALLCASAPQTVKAHLGDDPVVVAYLDKVRENPRYLPERNRLLEQFQRSDIGYGNARKATAAWLESAFADKATANAKLHCFADIEGPEVKRVQRARISSEIDDWWDNGATTPLALIGSEGTGKTWSVLAWWLERCNRAPDDLPLTLVVPAREIQLREPTELLANLLAQRTGNLHNVEFWKRRLAIWQRDRVGCPKILLMIDGLNQHPLYHDWTVLLQPLFAKEWKGQIGVILTCRTQYWQNELRQLANLIPQPQALTVGLFSPEEVDVLLGHYDLGRSEFSNDLLNLLRIPRYFQLAIKRRNQLQASGDITPERLIYEDWKHRLESRGSDLAISDLEFRTLIAKLGQRLQTSITERANEPLVTRKELLGELSENSGKTEQDLAQTLNEIIDGHWLSPIEGKPHHYKLSGELAPFALGLALLNDLKAAEEKGVPERMAQYFDPLRGTDHGTDILRSATTAAILDPQCPKPVREMLTREWISAQNIRTSDIDAMWKLMGEDPDLFLDLVEEFWLRPEQGVYSDDIFIGGLANAYRWPLFSETLQQRLVRWFSFYCLDPVRGQVLGYQHDDPKVHKRQARTQDRRRQWDVLSSQVSDSLKVSLTEIEVDDNGQGANPGWLSHRAAGLLSFLPRVAFEKTFLTWAVSRAVMGSPNHFDEIAWVLRLNTIDAVEAAKMIISLAERLIDHGHELTLLAARYLLDALATPEAAKRSADLPHPEHRARRFPDSVDIDARSGAVTWDHAKALAWPRSQEHPLDAALGLTAVAIRPDLSLVEDDIAVLRGLLDNVEPSSFWRHPRQHSSVDHSLDTALEALARWTPGALGGLLRGIYDTVSARGDETGWGIAHYLPEHLLVLRPGQREKLGDFAERILLPALRDRTDHSPWLNLQLVRLSDKSAADQIDLLSDDPLGPMLYLKHCCVLDTPTQEDFEHLSRFLGSDASTEQLRGWLAYLELVPLDALPDDYEPLARLIEHEDATVRSSALMLIVRAGRAPLLKAAARSGWRWNTTMETREAAYGSLALCKARQYCDVTDLYVRIDPQAIGHLVTSFPEDDEVLDQFATYIRQEYMHCREGRTLIGKLDKWTTQHEALQIFSNTRGGELIELLEALIADESRTAKVFSFESFPVISTLRALLNVRPEDGVRCWLRVWNLYMNSNWQIDDFEALPFVVTEHPSVLPLRDMVIDSAKTDAELMKLAAWVIREGRQSWLIAHIKFYLSEENPATIARGVTLAGFLNYSDETEKIWTDLIDDLPFTGWLDRVRTWAHDNYYRNAAACHWLNAFVEESDADRAFGYYVLFSACADQRALEWGQSLINDRDEQLPKSWRCHWQLNHERRKQVADKAAKDYEKRLFGTKIFKDTHAPWLRVAVNTG